MAVTRPTASVRNGACDHIVDQLNGGTIDYTVGAGGAVAATCGFGTPAFAPAGNPPSSTVGLADANAITADSDATGNASPVSHADLKSAGGTVIARCEVGIVGSGADIIMSSVQINAGDQVDTQSLTYETAP